MTKYSQQRCFVSFCKSRAQSQKEFRKTIRYFSCPKDVDKEAWKDALEKHSSSDKPFEFGNSRLCELHFEEKYIIRNNKYIVEGKEYEIPCQVRLLPDAVPTIFEPFYDEPKPKVPRPPVKRSAEYTIKFNERRKKRRREEKLAKVSTTPNVNPAVSMIYPKPANSTSILQGMNTVTALPSIFPGLTNSPIRPPIFPSSNHTITQPTTYIILPPDCSIAGTPKIAIDKINSGSSFPKFHVAPVDGSHNSFSIQQVPSVSTKSYSDVEVVDLSDSESCGSDFEFTVIKNDGTYEISLPLVLLGSNSDSALSECERPGSKRKKRNDVTQADLATLVMPTEDWSINIYSAEKTKTGQIVYTISETLLNCNSVEITHKSITLTHDWKIKITVLSHDVPYVDLFVSRIGDVQKVLNWFAQLNLCKGFSDLQDLAERTCLFDKQIDQMYRSKNCSLLLVTKSKSNFNHEIEKICVNCLNFAYG